MNRLALVTWRLPTASIDALEQAHEALGDPQAGIFQLTTCQRALLCSLAAPDQAPLDRADELAGAIGLPGGERRAGADAFRHLAQVTASLDAIVPGEDQVPHQVRQAIDDQAQSLGEDLLGLLQRVLAVSKTVRAEAGLSGHRTVSLADRALEPIPAGAQVALWGTGTIAEAALERLPSDPAPHVVSRTADRALALAGDPGHAWTRAAILDAPPRLDALILCTRAPDDRVLSPGDVHRLIEGQPAATSDTGTPALLLVDLGVPRNADPRIGSLPGIELRTVEHLARGARHHARDDERIQRARTRLEQALARERRRTAKSNARDRIVALRAALAADLDQLLADLDDDGEARKAALDRWADKAHGQLAHTAQAHLLAAIRGEAP